MVMWENILHLQKQLKTNTVIIDCLHISKKTNQHNISPMSLNDIICSVMSPISKQYVNISIFTLILIQKDQENLQNNQFYFQ